MTTAELARRAPLWIMAASALVLLAALGFQYLGGLAPCALCHYQRWAYVAAIVIAGVAPYGIARRSLVALCGVVFLAGAAVAFYHVGVEAQWFAGPAACSGPTSAAITVEELRQALLAQPVVRCDEVAWSLFGISMAGYNLIVSLALAAASVLAAAEMKGRA